MLTAEKAQLIAGKLKFKYSFTNYVSTIWIFFAKAAYSCHLLHDSSQQLTIRIHHYLWPLPVNATCLYAKCENRERQDLWDELIELGNSFIDVPWIIGGDFNVIFSPDEKKREAMAGIEQEPWIFILALQQQVRFGLLGKSFHVVEEESRDCSHIRAFRRSSLQSTLGKRTVLVCS